MSKLETANTLLVGYNYNEDTGNAVLVVGRKSPSDVVYIVNAFQGDEAKELWAKLTMPAIKKEEAK